MIDSENIAPETNTVDTVKADGKGGKGGKKTIEQIYQKKTQLEHILLRPVSTAFTAHWLVFLHHLN